MGKDSLKEPNVSNYAKNNSQNKSKISSNSYENRPHRKSIYYDINKNLEEFKAMFFAEKNIDFITRTVHIKAIDKRAVLLYLRGMADMQTVQRQIITPLMESEIDTQNYNNIIAALKNGIITCKGFREILDFKDAGNEILNGNTVLLVQGINRAISLDTADFQHRAIEKPVNENSLKGPKEAFVESEQVNKALIRKFLRDERLITESIQVGRRKMDTAYILYLQGIANEEIIQEAKRRINNIEADRVTQISLLEQHIEDRPYSLVPTTLETERPDRAAAFLQEGHVVLIMDGSPEILVVPVTFWSLFHNPEDKYQRWAYGNFIRIIRLICCFIALLTPSLYIAISSYHLDMIPTDLVLAIASSREKLPFPALGELLMMELAFEILREAGIRIPTPIGPTIGIVGALILGQAAVEANIVSPILVIIVSVTGLSSFAIPENSLNYMIRIGRFIFIAVGTAMGFLGVAAAFTVILAYITTIKSFGVYFMSPYAPEHESSGDMIIRPALWKELIRPMNLKPNKAYRSKKTRG